MNLLTLWNSESHHWFIHPDHETEYKKQARTLRKRLSKLKTDKAVPKYQSELKALRDAHRAYMNEHCITVEELENYDGIQRTK